MTVSSERRQAVLDEVRDLQNSSTKPREEDVKLDQALADLYSTLPRAWLTRAQYESGQTFRGSLFNADCAQYVGRQDIWLYADVPDTTKAIEWRIYRDGGNLILITSLNGEPMYFNWRNSTGACKLYSSYDRLLVNRWVSDDIFQMQNPANSQPIGTWSSTDYELYNRTNVSNPGFKFSYVIEDDLSADDRLIFDTYHKENPSAP
ncbi:hypothetical protein [Parafrankia discariae]|uniref:hypothetical protein n=1 Tax=Parafrankia discariae TaxID=365528 RepID=UPI00036DAC88|nr:hypothetical protein [Parafrankia discariae]